MKLYIVNGPNLNMLGIREPDIYGRHTYEDLVNELTAYCAEKGVEPIFVQSNHEGELVTAIQNAYFEEADGIVLNPAAYTHTSVALLDALKAIALPAVEVHLSDVSAREDFRQISYVREACIATISGKGFDGYKEAIDLLLQK
ncbi:MAG: 3-dehydroquinate dehydratase [Clostridia bacterium]|nr:3-dehydroquinate dehydratase [Clostridia bacterium]